MKGIPGRYISDTTPSHAIYPSSKQSWFLSLLVCSKALHCVGIFLVFDLLKTVDVVSLLFFFKLVAAAIFLYIQKPLSSGPQLSQTQWFRLGQYAVLRTVISLLWLYGISLCGPFRTILITQHYDIVIVTGIGALFSGVRGPAIVRGAALFSTAVVALLFLDHDEGQQHPGDSHLFSGAVSWLGLADHKLGVLFLCGFLPLQVGGNMLLKRVSTDIGSQHRVHAITTLMEAIICLPWALTAFWVQDYHDFYKVSNILPIFTAAISIFIVVYYVDSSCFQRFEVPRIARIGSISISLWALLTAVLWQKPWVTHGDAEIPPEHVLSGGGVLACGLFMLATLSLTSATRQGAKGSFIGYSASGLPLYNFTNSALHHTSRSIIIIVTNILKQILADNNSRRIFYFLCLNFSFTMVEFLYGIWTNSLGLISDGFHMLFDCSALVMGLLAAIMARWKPTKTFSYGYGRVEDLSGFVNGLFLLVIALFVFSEALSRLFDPPHINTQRLLIVSVAGLCVNLIGILAFRQSTSHSHGHHHGGHIHGHSHNANMEGVFLHIMADTLGSVGVIVSSILIERFGWFVADPICSLFIAVLIFLSVIPLLKQSAYVLLLRTPAKLQHKLASAIEQVCNVAGVVQVQEPHFWQHTSEVSMGTLHVRAVPEASEQNIIQQVCVIFKEMGIHQFCVQVEKEDFFTHMSGLSSQLKLPGFALEAETFFLVKAV